jgi:hypothetical protein
MTAYFIEFLDLNVTKFPVIWSCELMLHVSICEHGIYVIQDYKNECWS